MEVEKYEALRMDFKNLVSCIHWHEESENKDVVLETLKTIVDICSNEDCGRDAFREEGGLDFLVEFLFMTDNTIFLEHTLKTLAFVIDENVHSQMFMSTAQSLAFEVGLLQDLLNVYEYFSQALIVSSPCGISNFGGVNIDLWLSVNSALCFAVNNPQNETNQETCKNIFPVCLKILEFSSSITITNSTSSFLSLTISNNEKCQDYFYSCDGFLILKRRFHKYFDSLYLDMRLCNNIVAKGTFQGISSLVGIISAISLDHKKNATASGELGILSMMIKLLSVENLDCQLKTKIVLCLGHCIDACCDNKTFVLETENFDIFLRKSLQLCNAELSAACKYLLQVCLIKTANFEANNFIGDNDLEIPLKNMCNLENDSANMKGNSLPDKKRNKYLLQRSAEQSFDLKAKNMFSDYFEKKSSLSSPRSVSIPLTIKKKRHTKYPKSKPSPISSECLYNQIVRKNRSCANKNIAEQKEIIENVISSSSSNKQGGISNKFVDFLKKETKSNPSESHWETQSSAEAKNIKMDSFPQNFMVGNSPKLHKKQNNNFQIKESSESSSEFSLNSSLFKNEECKENYNDSGFGSYNPNQSELNCFADLKNLIESNKVTNSYESNNFKLNSKAMHFETFKNKPSISLSSNSSAKKDPHSELRSNASFNNFVQSAPESNLLSRYQRPFKTNLKQQIEAKNSNGSMKHTNTSFTRANDTLKMHFTPLLVSHPFSGSSSCSKDIECPPSNKFNLKPKTSNSLRESIRKRKRTWECSSTCTINKCLSDTSTPLNSKHVQVIVFPDKVCEEHGLNASIELLEVVSLEEAMT
ncbi:telomere repeats-binding bouquet formation protein 1 [Caerostris darwini]|uniref:Telomere repeats-binding bouquet formation protein 1 n=1 Tax=Caerostris darwini TaxID=1538125 RepID=A0AAV4NYZ5_9ARAC|nr:telomere repeats-binding bouquet formation protein 1 [Caerostris darwini]